MDNQDPEQEVGDAPSQDPEQEVEGSPHQDPEQEVEGSPHQDPEQGVEDGANESVDPDTVPVEPEDEAQQEEAAEVQMDEQDTAAEVDAKGEVSDEAADDAKDDSAPENESAEQGGQSPSPPEATPEDDRLPSPKEQDAAKVDSQSPVQQTESKPGSPSGSVTEKTRTPTPPGQNKSPSPPPPVEQDKPRSATPPKAAEPMEGPSSASPAPASVAAEAGAATAQSPSGQTPVRTSPPESPKGRAAGPPSPPTPTESAVGRAPAPPPADSTNQGKQAHEQSDTPAPVVAAEIPPAPPAPGELQEEAEQDGRVPNALNLSWSFGFNKNIAAINLTSDDRRMVGYASAHTGVLYDMNTEKQVLLQGHSNAVTCTCASSDKRWFVTADLGPDHMVIVWDSYTGMPVRTLFDPHPEGGVISVAMTPDAKYLATLSAAETQTFAIWDWTVESDTPICTAELKSEYGLQCHIYFNPEDTSQIVTNSDCQVIFYEWRGDQIQYFAPPLTDDDFNKPVGRFTQSIFQSNSTRALTATTLGNLVVWDTNKPLTKVVNKEPTPDKKALKLLKLQEKGISVLTTSQQTIVMGDTLGHVKFFDQKLKLVNWYQDFHLGPINSISFAHVGEFELEPRPGSAYPPDATIQARQFVLRDFVIGTTTAVIGHVTTDGTDVTVVLRDHDASVHALAAHPSRNWLAVGGYSGLLKVWDYDAKKSVMSRHFDRLMIRCCVYDPQGQMLAIGFTNGCVRIVNAFSLDDLGGDPFRYSREAITHMAFSHDCQYLAVADAEYTTTVFRRQVGVGMDPYKYMGRYRAHYQPIKEVMFGVMLDSNQPRLMTLGEDRHLVEYNLDPQVQDEIKLLSSDRIEQSAIPQCIAWYPPITKESFIVTANDQFKFKLYNSTTKMCRKTLLAPTYGSPVQKMLVLPTADPVKDKRYLVYITFDKIGLNIMPLDGNPHNAMALIAHPQGVTNVVCSHDGKHVFSAGGVDATVHKWDISIDVLEAQAALGGKDLVPFYGLLDDGREGDLFKELEDYFYYAQIRSQGVNTTEMRKVSTKILVTEIPFVMRALGFYPSEQEIDDMVNEVKFSNYVESGQYTSEIALGELIKLYINHRPAFGLQPDKLHWAFEVLGVPSDQGMNALERGDLLDQLQNYGEHMTDYELAECLSTLLGYNDEGGSSEQQELDTNMAADIIDQHLPEVITAEMFAKDLLGFGLYGDMLQGEEELPLQQPTTPMAS